jgi:hypothetical protein
MLIEKSLPGAQNRFEVQRSGFKVQPLRRPLKRPVESKMKLQHAK